MRDVEKLRCGPMRVRYVGPRRVAWELPLCPPTEINSTTEFREQFLRFGGNSLIEAYAIPGSLERRAALETPQYT